MLELHVEQAGMMFDMSFEPPFVIGSIPARGTDYSVVKVLGYLAAISLATLALHVLAWGAMVFIVELCS